ncbi:MAG: bifunctional DNA primase/polymerase, partial [Acidobacteriota bacterium]|nr:bifunctional DNA primase/polymerase [Acidobacteriota bacterium]
MSLLQSPPLGASDLAAQLNRDGANVVAIRTGDKAPAHAWKQWQRERQSEQDVLALPWALADRAGIINGIGGIRSFDFDGCPSTAPVAALLAALGLPADYPWCERSGSGKGFHVWMVCDDEIP